jgi:ATP-dependent DNA helicase RecG
VKYKNKEPSIGAITLDKRIYGTVPELIKNTFAAISENVGKRFTLKGVERREVLEYPEDSVREVITNAFGHRDYFVSKEVLIEIFPDRLKITNPGGLLPGQNIRNFERTPQHRNPIVYRLLHDLGLGEGLGLGVRMIRREFRESKLPDPDFFEIGNTFQVIFYNSESGKKRYSPTFLNERQKQALAYLEKHKTIKADEYAKMTGVSRVTAIRDLNELLKQGRIRKVGKYRGAYYEIERNFKLL